MTERADSYRELGIEAARSQLGPVTDHARYQDVVTFLTRNGNRVAAVVPLERVAGASNTATVPGDDSLRVWADGHGGWWIEAGSDGDQPLVRRLAAQGPAVAWELAGAGAELLRAGRIYGPEQPTAHPETTT